MKKYWINIVIVFALVLAALSYSAIKLKKTQNDLQLARLELAVQNDTILSFRTKDSTLVSVVKAVEIDRTVLKQALEELGLTNKQLKEEKIKWQSIASVLQAKLESQGSGVIHITDTVFVNKTDTIHSGKFNWSNEHLFLKGMLKEKTIDFNYLYKTDITTIQTKNRKGVQLSIILNDQNAKITSGSSIQVSVKKSLLEKWWITIPAGIAGGMLIAK